MDPTPRHERLSYAEAREALKGIVDHSKFAVAFVSAKGALGWLLRPLTIRGAIPALAMAPLEMVKRGEEVAIRVGRLSNGKIPVRFDTRLLRNLAALRKVAKHEMAELQFVLGFENQFHEPAVLKQLLERADDLGYQAEE